MSFRVLQCEEAKVFYKRYTLMAMVWFDVRHYERFLIPKYLNKVPL